jgi:hypothetical protein
VSIFNIDCYGFGVSTGTAEGHTPGDQSAAFNAQRALRLVRNILMASEYTHLNMKGTVWGRWPQSVNSFQPQIDAQYVQKIMGVRLALKVDFNEVSPQYDESNTLGYLAIDVTRTEDGFLVLEADYDYTA